ncbi:MAG: hypothetical protein H7196_04870 [candidate division SR1 bacterium]|nr:hypothetical protein [candidate division SR1 bacterium]
MPNKQLPAIGDSNWGVPLNSYITQTTDNTNGGGFNSFTNFVDRPTNLTVDDKGKTYLNNRTNNFHEWTGTTWNVRHTGGFVNVMDYGAITSTNDTAVVQAAIDYVQGSNIDKLYLPGGAYSFEVNISGDKCITVFGASRGGPSGGANTQVKAINPGGYAFSTHSTSVQHIEDMAIVGYGDFGGGNPKISNGIRCFPIPGVPQQSNFNPIMIKNVNFTACDIGLRKDACLFGKFENINFFGCNIGVFNKGGGTLYASLYSGFDQWNHCYWAGCEKVCVYYDNRNNYDENQTKFENCWFEGNPGIVCLALGTGIGLSSLKFSHCWFEANSQNRGQNITIDGVTYVIQGFVFKFARGVIEHGGLPNGVSLSDRSYLRLNYVATGNEGGIHLDEIQYDESSYLDLGMVGDSSIGGYGAGTSVMAEYAMLSYPSGATNAGLNVYKTKNNRPTHTRQYFNQVGSRFGVDGGTLAQIISGDGIYGNKCYKVDFPINNSNALFNIENDNTGDLQYFVLTFAVKSPQSNGNLYFYKNNVGGGGNIVIKDNKWHTYCGIFKDTAYGLAFKNSQNIANTVLFSKVQWVTFATYQEAADYLKSDFYALPPSDPISWHDSAIPTTGTYVKGDVIYNTSPTPGGYMGWTCIIAGTPGTWKGFGLIEA